MDNHPMEFSKIVKKQRFLVNVIVIDDLIRMLLEGDTIPCLFSRRGQVLWDSKH